MKFARYLNSHAIDEWQKAYINVGSARQACVAPADFGDPYSTVHSRSRLDVPRTNCYGSMRATRRRPTGQRARTIRLEALSRRRSMQNSFATGSTVRAMRLAHIMRAVGLSRSLT